MQTHVWAVQVWPIKLRPSIYCLSGEVGLGLSRHVSIEATFGTGRVTSGSGKFNKGNLKCKRYQLATEKRGTLPLPDSSSTVLVQDKNSSSPPPCSGTSDEVHSSSQPHTRANGLRTTVGILENFSHSTATRLLCELEINVCIHIVGPMQQGWQI
jgi:hypothetical protein